MSNSGRVRSSVLVPALSMVSCVLVAAMLPAISGCPAVDNAGNNNGANDGGNNNGGNNTGGNGGDSNQSQNGGETGSVNVGKYVVIGFNDLGMHCMNQDFSEMMILPPYNTLHAQVIERGGEHPRITDSGVTVRYRILNNTSSSDKTNFWTYANALLGVNLAVDVGLAGNSLSGTMKATGKNDWSAIGIPVTPIDDFGHEDPYPLASVTVDEGGSIKASTVAVTPVSWEISCDLCHTTAGISVATDILQKHDTLHGTNLVNSKPVLCAGCHADAALGLTGQQGVKNLSQAMHGAHASRMTTVSAEQECYACHPGNRTRCFRDVHYNRGMNCKSCHQSMQAVADPARRPWVDEPRCANCHNRAAFEFEQADTLYRNSKGHGGVHCEACHGSTHAITPTVVAADNQQAIGLQGHAGVISQCTVCHTSAPDESFPHRFFTDNQGGESGGN